MKEAASAVSTMQQAQFHALATRHYIIKCYRARHRPLCVSPLLSLVMGQLSWAISILRGHAPPECQSAEPRRSSRRFCPQSGRRELR
jgi:hypothetical protein